MVDLNLFLGSDVIMYNTTPGGDAPNPALPYFGTIPQDVLDGESEWVKTQIASSVELVVFVVSLLFCCFVIV